MGTETSPKTETATDANTVLPAVKNHCTIVCGWDENKKLAYMRTFDYENDKTEKELAQVAVKWCIDNCKGGWMISDISCVNITEVNE